MLAIWRRDNDEVDCGDDDQRAERTTSLKNVCWLYYLSVVFFWLLSLWSPTCWLWQRDNDEGWWWRQRNEGTTLPKKVRWLYYLSVVLSFFKNLFVVSHMLAMAEGQRRGGWW